MYESDKGKNEWHLEMLGELIDFTFISEQQAYTLSSDALLTLFDTDTQTIQWKKQLPRESSDETYTLRRLGRNLIVHSDERVVMVNSVGHVIFENPLEGMGPSVVEFYSSGEDIFSAFIREDRVTIYKAHQPTGSFVLDQITSLPAGFEPTMEPLQLIHKKEQDRLILVSKIGKNKDTQQSQLAVYSIDFRQLTVEVLHQYTVANFISTERTKNFVVLHTKPERKSSLVINPLSSNLNEAKMTFSSILQPSQNDDFIFMQEGTKLDFLDLSEPQNSKTSLSNLPSLDSTCRAMRPRESELGLEKASADDVVLVFNCKAKISVKTVGNVEVYTGLNERDLNGDILRVFSSTQTKQLLMLFEDLSNHYVQNGRKRWVREEALSQIMQVDVFDSHLMVHNKMDTQHEQLSYLNDMGDQVSIAQVPLRIMQRYTENFRHLVTSVANMVNSLQGSDDTSIAASEPDVFGFDKTFVVLTKPGKIIAFSSLTGNVLWAQRVSSPIDKLFVEQGKGHGTVEIKVITTNGQIYMLDPLNGVPSAPTALPKLPQPQDQTEFMLIQGTDTQTGEHRQALIGVPKQGEGEVVLCQEGVKLEGGKPFYLSQVDKESGRVAGYKLDVAKMTIMQTWSVKIDSNSEIIDIKTQYDSISTASRANQILPTVFGEDGELFYKFLDTNIFALITAPKKDHSVITLQLINSVTGRVIHQFQERDVSPSSQHQIATLLSEQYLAVSYMRLNPATGISQQELTVIELYAKKQESDAQQLLMDYFKGADRIVSDSYSSFLEESEPEVLSESYIVPFGIKAMALTETANHITGRALVLITSEHKIYSMREMLFSARRPRPDLAKAELGWLEQAAKDLEEAGEGGDQEVDMQTLLKTKTFPAYEAVLTQQDTLFISYNLPLIGLESIHTYPTRLESTSQVFAYGHDLFLSRYRPDKKFDMLDEEFNFPLLFAFIGFLLVANVVASKYMRAQGERKTFLLF